MRLEFLVYTDNSNILKIYDYENIIYGKNVKKKEQRKEKRNFLCRREKKAYRWSHWKKSQVVWFNWQTNGPRETSGNVGHAHKFLLFLHRRCKESTKRAYRCRFGPIHTQNNVYVYACNSRTQLLQFVDIILQELTDRCYCLSLVL